MKSDNFCLMILAACFAIFPLTARANSYMQQSYGKEKIATIRANGLLKLDGTTVTSFLEVNGNLTAKEAQIEAMQIHGSALMKNCAVNQKSLIYGALTASSSKFADLEVNGNLTAEDVQIGMMQIHGRVSMKNSTVAEKSLIYGTLIASSSKFAEEISISSQKTILSSCSLKSIHILKQEGIPEAQIIELKGKTKVNGSIIFESGNGEVLVSSDSEIVGKIVGGKIKKE